MITFILMAIGMAVSILVKTLHHSRGAAAGAVGGAACKGGGNAKEWLRNKLKALASLLERLHAKVAETLPGIVG